jgi:hypothetical protein
MALTILCVSFTLLLLLGVPVAFSIGLSALATLLYEGLPLAVGFQQMISGMNPSPSWRSPSSSSPAKSCCTAASPTASSTSAKSWWATCAAAWA